MIIDLNKIIDALKVFPDRSDGYEIHLGEKYTLCHHTSLDAAEYCMENLIEEFKKIGGISDE